MVGSDDLGAVVVSVTSWSGEEAKRRKSQSNAQPTSASWSHARWEDPRAKDHRLVCGVLSFVRLTGLLLLDLRGQLARAGDTVEKA